MESCNGNPSQERTSRVLSRASPGTQLFLSHACSTGFLVMGSHGAPQKVAGVLVPGPSRQDSLASGLFPGSRVPLLFVGDPVCRECIAVLLVVEGRWSFVCAVGILTDASDAQLESCDDALP